MSPRTRRLLTWAGYGAFYLACLVLFAYVTLPYARLKHQVLGLANPEAGESGTRIEVGELSWSWHFPGVSLSGVRFVAPPGKDAAAEAPEAKVPKAEPSAGSPEGKAEPGEEGAGEPRAAAEEDAAEGYVRISLLPLLVGTKTLGLSFDAFGGTIDGHFSDSSDGREIELELDRIDAGRLPYLRDLVGLPMSGSLSGSVQMELPQGKLSEATGQVELRIEECLIGDGKAKIRETIALPRLEAGTIEFKAEAEKGRITITQMTTKGSDLEMVAEGRVSLAERVASSIAELSLRFRFSDKYKGKNEMTKGLFGEPGSKVPGLFDLDPKIRRAKRDDGFYAWTISGPLGTLRFEPQVGGAPGGRAGSRGRSRRLRGFE